ncbi:flagellar hook-length control protein FliK [Halobacillus karajensis]|uniref:Flagellar hook-length control protein FliK n=1 Tax=Halobacillus karajensis TaxID=195088 RepID=A0A024P1M1_9BACI|nr:flagellar hook-length control protein FliK [Halobacillus karajensis]CDQ19739.1 Flagellar hook-length control protein FliK [Halobacillus karajensis]CDQ22199.1 Flagellar hook-length control protein FliK [Halobacillus karajensis]CDQ28040.1 Flagellar hook-length control protein FliK [Halobacillus karajensis]
MNMALKPLLGHIQKLAVNRNGNAKEQESWSGTGFQSFLTKSQLTREPHFSKKNASEDSGENLRQLLKDIESFISTMRLEGEISEKEAGDWAHLLSPSKEALHEEDLSKLIQSLEILHQKMMKDNEQSMKLLPLTFNPELLQRDLSFFRQELRSSQESGLSGDELKIGSPQTQEKHYGFSTPSSVRRESELHKIWQEFKSIVQSISKSNQLEELNLKAGKELKQTMEKLMQLIDSLPKTEKNNWQTIMGKGGKEGSPQEKQLFNKLITVFQNRVDVPKAYHQQTPITGRDIAKLVKQSIGEGVQQEQKHQSLLHSPFSPSTPMTKVEQYVIQLNQNQHSSSSQVLLIQEMKRMIQSSRMFSNARGTTELLLKLRPGNFGDLTVRFSQMNGEMAVKILVTSQAVKEMLDGNMGQLRHMFSPQQVVVEKVDASMLQQQTQEQLESGDQEEEQGQRNQPYEHESIEENEEEELSFHDILLNKKA